MFVIKQEMNTYNYNCTNMIINSYVIYKYTSMNTGVYLQL